MPRKFKFLEPQHRKARIFNENFSLQLSVRKFKSFKPKKQKIKNFQNDLQGFFLQSRILGQELGFYPSVFFFGKSLLSTIKVKSPRVTRYVEVHFR